MKRVARVLCVVCLLALALGPGAFAAEKAKGGQVPTKITSEKVRYEQDGRVVIFLGKVFVQRPDMTIRSRKLTVHLAQGASGAAPGRPAGPGEVERIVAEGDVELEREGRQGTCATATYHVQKGLLVMEGEPRLTDGDNQITGRIIRLYLKDNRSEVEGGPDRQVEAIFMTPPEAE
ncbi:LptA/OstA family protein [Desulfocurvus sp.]|uniref:LptA/OstA family protein n=1 Tax=Desulfocurvus sp. TaxID=2871698 RepID=UPI0025C1B0E4|nr:LptA/OstA family protein [Desulfocurvus sp.]MCK9241484.1 LptA/OstA family protein [Desulfocurvus sp.]